MKEMFKSFVTGFLSATVVAASSFSATGEILKRSDATTSAPSLELSKQEQGLKVSRAPMHRSIDALTRVSPITPAVKVPKRPAAAPVYGAPSFTPAYACLTYSNDWSNTSAFPYQITSVSTISSAFNTIATGSQFVATNGAVYTPHGYFTAVGRSIMGMVIGMTYYVSDPETFSITRQENGSLALDAASMTYDPSTDMVFSFYTNGQKWSYGTFDISSFSFSEIRSFDDADFPQWVAMLIDGNGQLYAINQKGILLKVEKLTGEYETIGNTGLHPKFASTAAYNPNNGKSYFYLNNDAGSTMNELDLTTGEATQLYYANNDQIIQGMFFYPLDPANGSPAGASDLTADFADGSLTGTLNFSVPSTTVDGEAGTGSVNYQVLVDGAVKAEATATWGETVGVSLTVVETGFHTFGVILSNDKGSSQIQTIRTFIGEDTPTAVRDLKAEYSNGQFKISWTAPGTTNGGYINPANLSYKVTRMPEGTVVAENLTATEYTDNITVPDEAVSFSYTVTTIYDGQEYASTTSTSTTVGFIAPPYTENFNSKESFDAFTVENTNNDNAKWEYSEKYACLLINLPYNPFGSSSHNDWIFTPEIKVEKGKNYVISFDAVAKEEGYPEFIEAKVGNSPASASMTTPVIEGTNVTSTNMTHYSGVYEAPESGIIYIGLHTEGTTGWQLRVDNLSISAGIDMSAPAQVTNVAVTPDPTGLTKAVITFDAPTIDVKGNQLRAINEITISRNGTQIGSVQGAPGQSLRFEDTNEDSGIINGENTYVITAVNQGGTGTPYTAKCFIGFGAPAQVTGAAVKPGSDYGTTVLTWNAVTADVDGHPIPQSRVFYIVTRVIGNIQEEIYKGTELTFTDHVCGVGDTQRFVYYGVQAATGDDIMSEVGEYGMTDMLPVGKPDATPWFESFKGSSISNVMATLVDSEASWIIVGDTDVNGLTSFDKDNGMAVMTSSATDPVGQQSTLTTGRISINGIERPYLTFYYFGYESQNSLDVFADDGNGFNKLTTLKIGDANGWVRCALDLSAYKGKDIRIGFRGLINDNPVIAIDRITIDNMYDFDLRSESITAPSRVDPGEEFGIMIAYRNYGLQKAANYKLSVYLDGEAIGSYDAPELEPGAGAQLKLGATLPVIGNRENAFHFTLDWNDDENQNDNKSETAAVVVRIPDYPVVTDLTGDSDETTATLTWSDPDLSQAPFVTTVEDVESFPAFSIGMIDSDVDNDNLGDWTVYDADGQATYTISGDYYFTNQGRPYAFIAFNSESLGLDWRLTPHSGKQMFLAMSAIGAPSDDWLISPELSGDAQEITFWAWNADRYYGAENVEVLYSTTGNAPEDFVSLEKINDVPGSWTEYACKLPEGAKYFALRRTCNNAFMFCLDDIRFIAAGAERTPLSVIGYNVYRNNTLITGEPVVANDFADNMLPDGDNEYLVSVVYDLGESGASNKVTLRKKSDISSVNALNASVYAEKMTIVINSGAGKHLDIVNQSGVTVYSAESCNDLRINVAAHGVYLVKLGNRVYKVVI